MSDDRDWGRDSSHPARASRDRSTALRAGLREVGIELDEAKPSLGAVASPQASAEPEVDRAAIREILVARGAPERSLDWLTASCPGPEYAATYNPPAPPKRRGYPPRQVAVSDPHATQDKESDS